MKRRYLRSCVRLQVEGVRESPRTAQVVADTLRAIPGVLDVTADPRTGSLTFSYEPASAPDSRPSDEPELPGLPAVVTRGRPPQVVTWLGWVVKTVAVVAVEVALQRALGPLFLPRRC